VGEKMKRLTIAALGICLSMNAAAGQWATLTTSGGTAKFVDGFPCVFTMTNEDSFLGTSDTGNGVLVYFKGDESAFSLAQAFTPNCDNGIDPEPVPELDGAGALLGLGLVGALVAIYRERRRRIKVSSAT
jgi:hypothetical protein